LSKVAAERREAAGRREPAAENCNLRYENTKQKSKDLTFMEIFL
jgi:hypothetical protein